MHMASVLNNGVHPEKIEICGYAHKNKTIVNNSHSCQWDKKQIIIHLDNNNKIQISDNMGVVLIYPELPS